MENIDDNFFVCKDYKRFSFDFNEIQWNKNNPINSKGYPVYPFVMPSSSGTSYTYKLSDDLFFKRKLQDGNNAAVIFSQHHYTKTYNELMGSFDDLAEVICYFLSKNMINPKTGEKLINVAEYALATYTDKEGIMLRGCLSKNVCEDAISSRLISMADLLKRTQMSGNSINTYMAAIEKYCKSSIKIYDLNKIKRTLIKNSYFCWKVANSDNHKNNITFVLKKSEDGKSMLEVSALIDNGSAYELSSPYILSGQTRPRVELLLENDKYSKVGKNGERELEFSQYPYTHNAFNLDTSSLLFDDKNLSAKTFSYEYCLASEMLSDPELYFEIYEIEKQFNLEKMQEEIDQTYGLNLKGEGKHINWPPLLKEYMKATNKIKSNTLAAIVADYYLYAAYSLLIGAVDKNNPSENYKKIREYMLNLPLQENKEAYDKIFITAVNELGLKIDLNKVTNIKFKKQEEKILQQ